MKALVSVIAATAALFAAPAYAQVYGSAGYTMVSSSDDVVDVDLGAVTGRIGTHFNKNLGAEAEASFGIADDTTTFSGFDVDVSLNNEFAAYVVGFVPLNDNFELLGRVGFGTAEVEADAGGGSVSDSGSGVHYGVGAQWFFAAHHGLRADYTRMESIDANAWSIAYAFRF